MYIVYAALFLPFSHQPPGNWNVAPVWKTTYTDTVKKIQCDDNKRIHQVEDIETSI